MTAHIPDRLTQRPQWVCWRTIERDGKQTKLPVDPAQNTVASVRTRETWGDYTTAETLIDSDPTLSGVGFVFTDTDPFVGVDLDDCRDPETGRPDAWAKTIIQQLDSYTEVSPSGTGYHVYVEARLPDGGNRRGNVECYETHRFFTVTGDHVTGTPKTIQERQQELTAIHAEHIGGKPRSNTDCTVTPSTLDDDSLLERARNAKNGEKFSRLWHGDTTSYESHSEADMALCFLLAFWTGNDAHQMDRVFRRSGLYRDKWDDVHYGDGRTYGEATIERARHETTETYTPKNTVSAQQTSTPGEDEVSQQVETDLTALEADLAALRKQTRKLTTRTTTLHQETERLSQQSAYLHEQLETERRKRARLSRRIHHLEDTRTPSLWRRLFKQIG